MKGEFRKGDSGEVDLIVSASSLIYCRRYFVGNGTGNLTMQTAIPEQAMHLANATVNLTANLTAYTERPAQAMNLMASVDMLAEALRDKKQNITQNLLRANDSCGRWDIMGNVVHLSAPYLYPFVIEYSLIGAAVIYIMWRHIGRSPR